MKKSELLIHKVNKCHTMSNLDLSATACNQNVIDFSGNFILVMIQITNVTYNLNIRKYRRVRLWIWHTQFQLEHSHNSPIAKNFSYLSPSLSHLTPSIMLMLCLLHFFSTFNFVQPVKRMFFLFSFWHILFVRKTSCC